MIQLVNSDVQEFKIETEMIMQKFVILCGDKSRYLFPYMNGENVKVFSVYKKQYKSIFMRILLKFLYYSGFKLYYLFYSNWTKFLHDDVTFVVFDEVLANHRLKNCLKACRNTPIFYFWNPIVIPKNKVEKLKKNYDVYTYSKFDSLAFDIKFNNQFFCKINRLNEYKTMKVYFDCIFCGYDKGRMKKIIKIYNCCKEPYFHVLQSNKGESCWVNFKFQERELPYFDYLKLVLKSNCVLDICPQKDSGLTLRALEAVAYNKKLITDNKNVLNEKFYSTENVLIFDENTSDKTIRDFLSSPPTSYNVDFEGEYSFDSWLKRFSLNRKKDN